MRSILICMIACIGIALNCYAVNSENISQEIQVQESTGSYAQMEEDVIVSSIVATLEKLLGHRLPHIFFETIVSYFEVKSLDYRLFLPQTDEATLKPLVIFAHGGGFISGSKDDNSTIWLCKELSKRGYATASIDYRLMKLPNISVTNAGYLAIQDGKAAVRYFRANAAKWNISPDHIYFGGISAGGMVALHTAFLEEHEAQNALKGMDNLFGCLDCVGDHFNASSTPNGVINIVGGSPFTDIYNENISTLHLYCSEDQIVPNRFGFPFLPNEFFNTWLGQMAIEWLEIPHVYGPETLARYMNSSGYSSKKFYNCNHSLMHAVNGTLKSSARIVLDEILYFLDENTTPEGLSLNLPDSISRFEISKIQLPQIKGEVEIKISGGIILKKTQSEVNIIWTTSEEGTISYRYQNELGRWSDVALYKLNIEEKLSFDNAKPFFIGSAVFSTVVLSLLTFLIKRN